MFGEIGTSTWWRATKPDHEESAAEEPTCEAEGEGREAGPDPAQLPTKEIQRQGAGGPHR